MLNKYNENPRLPGRRRQIGIKRLFSGTVRYPGLLACSSRRKGLLAGLLLASMGSGLLGHPGLQEQVAALSLELERQPGNASLWLRRSEVRRQLGNFKLSLADLDAAERLKPGWPIISMARARTLYDGGSTAEALDQAEKFLKLEPEHAAALVLRARCWVKLGQPQKAASAYTEALKHFAEPSPDLFLERARLQASLGRFAAVVSGLDEGINRLGPAPALERAVIEYERQRGDFEAALARADQMAARAAVKEPMLVLRAELLEHIGRFEEAATAFQQSLEGLEKYSISRRALEATKQLEKRARQGLARVRAKLASRNPKGIGSSSPEVARNELPWVGGWILNRNLKS